MQLFTIGFTKTSAESFFARLTTAGVRQLIDVRLNNGSQLAGFAKKNDLRYFVNRLCAIPYEHTLAYAPTQEMLEDYRRHRNWQLYEGQFLELMARRKIETLDPPALDHACLLCSESRPDRCHRRLVAEYLNNRWGDIEIVHL